MGRETKDTRNVGVRTACEGTAILSRASERDAHVFVKMCDYLAVNSRHQRGALSVRVMRGVQITLRAHRME